MPPRNKPPTTSAQSGSNSIVPYWNTGRSHRKAAFPSKEFPPAGGFRDDKNETKHDHTNVKVVAIWYMNNISLNPKSQLLGLKRNTHSGLEPLEVPNPCVSHPGLLWSKGFRGWVHKKRKIVSYYLTFRVEMLLRYHK